MSEPLSSHGNLSRTSPEYGVLSAFSGLAAPAAILHIGVGAGIGPLAVWRDWSVPTVLIIDADESRLAWARSEAKHHLGWHVAALILDTTDGEADYFTASNPDESGLCDPSQLTTVWPNLQTRTCQTRSVCRLDRYLAQIGLLSTPNQGPMWLFVDCFPALRILDGCGNVMDNLSVVGLRVLLDASHDLMNSTLTTVSKIMTERGFCLVHVSETLHPAVGYAFFVRDWPKQLRALQEKLQDQLLQEDQAQVAINLLTIERDEQARIAAKRQTIIESMTAERDEQARIAAERQDAIESVISERDEQARIAAERQTVIKTMAAERDEQARIAAECQKAIESIAAERDEQAQIAADSQKQCIQLENQQAEMGMRQSLLQEELFKAEAQMELIKDLIARGTGLWGD